MLLGRFFGYTKLCRKNVDPGIIDHNCTRKTERKSHMPVGLTGHTQFGHPSFFTNMGTKK